MFEGSPGLPGCIVSLGSLRQEYQHSTRTKAGIRQQSSSWTRRRAAASIRASRRTSGFEEVQRRMKLRRDKDNGDTPTLRPGGVRVNRQSPPITTCQLSCVIKVPERQQSPLIRSKLVRRAFTFTSTLADLCTHTQHTLADIRLGLHICRVLGRIPALTHAARLPVQEGVTHKPILV